MENLPLGFRFYPTEEELVSFYLRRKLQGATSADIDLVIPVVNIYHHSPWHLPQVAGELSRGDSEQWFYFIPGEENRARGGKPNRLTRDGYWKATGSPSFVYSSMNEIIGEKRTMVFHTGRAPGGTRTQWKMNEYKAAAQVVGGQGGASASCDAIAELKLCHEFSLCRLYKKSKCDRSFDRRPPEMAAATGAGGGAPPPPPQHNHLPAALMESERSSSSTAGDYATPPSAMEYQYYWDTCAPLWDWEDLNINLL
nr:NAC domain-containing protein 90-like [Ipomoea batatas]